MDALLSLIAKNPLTDAAAAMGANGVSSDFDDAMEEGFFPPEAQAHFELKEATDDRL